MTRQAACNRCWEDALDESRRCGGSQADHYGRLLVERDGTDCRAIYEERKARREAAEERTANERFHRPVVCVIEVGHSPETPAEWQDLAHPELVVCDRHKRQYETAFDDYSHIEWSLMGSRGVGIGG